MKKRIRNKWKLMRFSPPSWLKNKHLQTILGSIYYPLPKVDYRRERLSTPDDDFIDVDWVDGKEDAPLVLACHGLEGSSSSHYIIKLMHNVKMCGWNGAVLNFRSCSGTMNKQLTFYNMGDTSDLHWLIERIYKTRKQRIYVVGFSLGGNVTAKWLGTFPDASKEYVKGACICSAPYSPVDCQKLIDTGLVNKIYLKNFFITLKDKFHQKLSKFPSDAHNCDINEILAAKTFKEFDDKAIARLYGFKDYLDYYQQSASKPYLKNIVVPTLLISALDDPIVPAYSFPTESEINNDTTLLHYTEHGGHIGFISRKESIRWLDQQITSWFSFCEEIG